jgi:hypothetical protein
MEDIPELKWSHAYPDSDTEEDSVTDSSDTEDNLLWNSMSPNETGDEKWNDSLTQEQRTALVRHTGYTGHGTSTDEELLALGRTLLANIRQTRYSHTRATHVAHSADANTTDSNATDAHLTHLLHFTTRAIAEV